MIVKERRLGRLLAGSKTTLAYSKKGNALARISMIFNASSDVHGPYGFEIGSSSRQCYLRVRLMKVRKQNFVL
jgi:hypothetical protein